MDEIVYIVVNRDGYFDFTKEEFPLALWTYRTLSSRTDMPTTLLARTVNYYGDLKKSWFEFQAIDFI